MSSEKKKLYSILLGVPIILACIGIFFVFEASPARAVALGLDQFYFVTRQIGWIVAGVIIMIIISRLPIRILFYVGVPLVVLSLSLLVLVLIPGVAPVINGAKRWITVGAFSLQPAELAKLAIILYLASWFRERHKKRITAFIVILFLFEVLIMMQPDMGTAMILAAIAVGMYFLSGVEIKKLALIIPIFILLALATAWVSPYRMQRIMVFTEGSSAASSTVAYHHKQIDIAFQNGGLLGLGLGASKQKYLYLPEAHTDSIFPIIVEETGYLGGLGIIALYTMLIIYLAKLVSMTRDPFANMLVCGTLLFFAAHTVVNLAAMTGLMPLTGVPLPFISYGGTHILVAFTLIGVSLAVARTT